LCIFAEVRQTRLAMLTQHMYRQDKVWHCGDCPYTSKIKKCVTAHLESSHFDFGDDYECNVCHKRVKTWRALIRHGEKVHKKWANKECKEEEETTVLIASAPEISSIMMQSENISGPETPMISMSDIRSIKEEEEEETMIESGPDFPDITTPEISIKEEADIISTPEIPNMSFDV